MLRLHRMQRMDAVQSLDSCSTAKARLFAEGVTVHSMLSGSMTCDDQADCASQSCFCESCCN